MEKIQTDFSFKSSSFRILLLQPIPGKRQRLPAADGVKPPLGPQARSRLTPSSSSPAQQRPDNSHPKLSFKWFSSVGQLGSIRQGDYFHVFLKAVWYGYLCLRFVVVRLSWLVCVCCCRLSNGRLLVSEAAFFKVTEEENGIFFFLFLFFPSNEWIHRRDTRLLRSDEGWTAGICRHLFKCWKLPWKDKETKTVGVWRAARAVSRFRWKYEVSTFPVKFTLGNIFGEQHSPRDKGQPIQVWEI